MLDLPTVLVGLAVLALFAAVVVKLVRDRKNGKGSCACGGDCSHCKGCK